MTLIEYYPKGKIPHAILYEQTTKKGIILREEEDRQTTHIVNSKRDWIPEFYPQNQTHYAETAPFHTHIISDQQWKTIQAYAKEGDHDKVFSAARNLEARLDGSPMHVYKRREQGSERKKEQF